MFVITLSNMFVTDRGINTEGISPFPGKRLTWPTLEVALKAATALNAQYGLHAYIHPADRTDRTVEAVTTHSFGYAS